MASSSKSYYNNTTVCSDITPEISKKNDKLINQISFDDLNYIEKDLKFYEKVSLVFLLYGHNNCAVGLQKLLVESQIPIHLRKSTTYLSDWARTNEKWLNYLLEAMAIVNLYHCLTKLGLHIYDLNERYLPKNPEVNLFIHPILKVLYIIIENLDRREINELICFMQSKHNSLIINNLYFEEFTEIHLLDWMHKNIISIGDWDYSIPNVNINNFCNVDNIIEFLKLNDRDMLKDILKSTSIRLNYTKFNSIPIDSIKERTKISKDCNYQNSKSLLAPELPKCSYKAENTPLADRYKLNKRSAGYIVIINQKNFEKTKDPRNELKCRTGTDIDKMRLIKTFEPFGYKAIVENNLKANEVFSLIKKIVNLSNDKDSLIVCILSHGRVGTFYSSDCNQIKISSIKNLIASEHLIGKPKLLIVQACQIAQVDPDNNFLILTESEPLDVEKLYDTITAWSTIPGTVSYRDTQFGTWFIQSLCDAIDKFGTQQHVLEIFTEVCRELKDKKGPNNEAMVPNIENNLVKKFYFASN